MKRFFLVKMVAIGLKTKKKRVFSVKLTTSEKTTVYRRSRIDNV